MKILVLIVCSALILNAFGQNTNVFDCQTFLSVPTQADINAVPEYNGTCILFNDLTNYSFNGAIDKKVTAANEIVIKENFFAGDLTNGGEMKFAIERNPMDRIFVMNYQDLNAVLRYKKLELALELPIDVFAKVNNFVNNSPVSANQKVNPFLEWELDVEAVFYHPQSGTTKRIDAFYYRPYIENIPANDWIPMATETPMRVRFSPPLNGRWTCRFEVNVKNGEEFHVSDCFAFNVVESGDLGYVKVHTNHKNLVRGNRMIFPVGHNLPFPDDGVEVWTVDDENTEKAASLNAWIDYYNLVEAYMQQGGKYVRLIQRPQSNLIEFEERGNYYDRLHYAWETDRLLDMLESYDALILFNLMIQEPIMKYANYGMDHWDWDHYKIDGTYDYSDDYPVYCYNTNPGVKLAREMFTNSEDLAYHKQRTRYYISRYGYSTNIYDFEILSEPWHLEESYSVGQGNQASTAPFFQNLDVRNAIYNYHSVISSYIKNDLNHTEHLVGIDMAYLDKGMWNDNTYDLSMTLPNVDIVGFNPYFTDPSFLLITYSSGNFSEENSMYAAVTRIRSLANKPVIISEGGTNEAHHTCSNWTQHRVDVMTLGFTGLAGFNSWNGLRQTETHLWPNTIRAQLHMNGDDVINTLSQGGGLWSQGRDHEKLQYTHGKEAKELQYYVSADKQFAVGYVRNRCYNVHTKATNSTCVLSLSTPLWELQDITWQQGSNLFVKSLSTYSNYEITWYSFDAHESTSCRETQVPGVFGNADAFKLEHPELYAYSQDRPVMWFVLKRKNCVKSTLYFDAEMSNDNSSDLSLKSPYIYPNPSSEELFIELPIGDEIRISNNDGTVLFRTTLPSGKSMIPVADLDVGIYFISFSNAGITLKFVKI